MSAKRPDSDFTAVWRGYKNGNIRKLKGNEPDAFITKNSSECTKDETDTEYGNIPRIIYIWMY